MEQKIAVVTGASKGIGLEIAKMLLGRDYTVYGLARRPGADDRVCWISCDVTDRQSVEKVFSRILEKEDRIDLLVCNAGIGISGAAEFAPEADYRADRAVQGRQLRSCLGSGRRGRGKPAPHSGTQSVKIR